ncbi:MAG: PAS domain-containing protein, partial [Firmicutes bacterium]|nr:PAS domain-containing protein [Bacillota bacterium]
MNETRYELILNELLRLLDEGVYIVDENGSGLFYNSSMAEIEQINVEDVVGREYHKAFPGIKLSESTLFQALKKGVSTLNKQQTYT